MTPSTPAPGQVRTTPPGAATWKAADYVSENTGRFATALEALALAGAHLHSGGRFADVGCGSGEIAEAMADRHFEVTANDGSPSMVEATRSRCAGKSVTVEHQDAHRLELPESAFDVVHSSWMLHRLTDPHHALRTMARAVRPGGLLVLQWSFGQPAAAGFPMREVLAEVVARPAWRERLAATPLAMYQHPVELVRRALEEEGLAIVVEQRDLAVPGPGDGPALRRTFRTAGLDSQAEALGEDADAFVDEALDALFEAGRTDVHHTRIIALRPDDDARPPAPVRPFPQSVGVLEVVSAAQLSPLVRRVVLRGPSLDGLVVEQPGEIITLIWPAEGATEVVLPEPGHWRFPERAAGQHTRNFTVREFDRAAGLLTIDFFLHGDGRAAGWGAAAAPGDTVGYGGGRVHWAADPEAGWTLLAGDETALPAVSAIIASLSAGHPVTVVAEVRDAAEHAALDTGGATVHWLHRGDREPGRGRALEEAVRALELPTGRGQVWAAGESMVIQSLRAHLVKERGLPRDTVSALGYWNRPRARRRDG